MSLPPAGAKTRVPLKQHLVKVWESTGKKPQQLAEQPPLDPAVKYLWQWYLEIHTDYLTYQEIESWSELTKQKITPREVEVLRKLNGLYREIINGRSFAPDN